MQVRNAGLGAAICARRKEKGLTQTELAELAGVSLRFVSEVERGRDSASMGLSSVSAPGSPSTSSPSPES